MFAIQSIASGRFFRFKDQKYVWVKEAHYPFRTMQAAAETVKQYKLREIKVFGEMSVKPVINSNNSVTRVDRNIDFLTEIRLKAQKFGMKTVGIKSIDKVLNEDTDYKPQVYVCNTKTESYPCYINGNQYEVFFEHVSKGKIQIIGYKKYDREIQSNQKIARLKKNGPEIDGLIIKIFEPNNIFEDEYNIPIKVDEKEYEVVNPHSFLQGVNSVSIKMIESENNFIRRSEIVPERTHLAWINKAWWVVTYEHTSAGHIRIINYTRTEQTVETGREVAFIRIEERNVIKLALGVLGKRKHDRSATYVVDNQHSFIVG